MNIPNGTQAKLCRLVDECQAIMSKADAAGRDLTAGESERVRTRAAEFEKIRDKARFAPTVTDRADLRKRLRFVGLSKASAERVATVGWPVLTPKASVAGAAEAIRAAAKQLRR